MFKMSKTAPLPVELFFCIAEYTPDALLPTLLLFCARLWKGKIPGNFLKNITKSRSINGEGIKAIETHKFFCNVMEKDQVFRLMSVYDKNAMNQKVLLFDKGHKVNKLIHEILLALELIKDNETTDFDRMNHRQIPSMLAGSPKFNYQLWDMSLKERFRSISEAYFRGADICVFSIDMSDEEYFQETFSLWVKTMTEYMHEPYGVVLVPYLENKINQVISVEQLVTYAQALTHENKNIVTRVVDFSEGSNKYQEIINLVDNLTATQKSVSKLRKNEADEKENVDLDPNGKNGCALL